MTAHGLIDTTEMYLRTVFELEEEGIVRCGRESQNGSISRGRRLARRWRGWSGTDCCAWPTTGIWR